MNVRDAAIVDMARRLPRTKDRDQRIADEFAISLRRVKDIIAAAEAAEKL
jgi:hypothetical protein